MNQQLSTMQDCALVNIGGVNALCCAEDEACYNDIYGYRATFTASQLPSMAAGM